MARVETTIDCGCQLVEGTHISGEKDWLPDTFHLCPEGKALWNGVLATRRRGQAEDATDAELDALFDASVAFDGHWKGIGAEWLS